MGIISQEEIRNSYGLLLRAEYFSSRFETPKYRSYNELYKVTETATEILLRTN